MFATVYPRDDLHHHQQEICWPLYQSVPLIYCLTSSRLTVNRKNICTLDNFIIVDDIGATVCVGIHARACLMQSKVTYLLISVTSDWKPPGHVTGTFGVSMLALLVGTWLLTSHQGVICLGLIGVFHSGDNLWKRWIPPTSLFGLWSRCVETRASRLFARTRIDRFTPRPAGLSTQTFAF